MHVTAGTYCQRSLRAEASLDVGAGVLLSAEPPLLLHCYFLRLVQGFVLKMSYFKFEPSLGWRAQHWFLL